MNIYLGDCRAMLRDMAADSVDSVVVDPPYELGFMGKTWDSTGIAFDPETWSACLRVLKPGGHLVAFGGTRTIHRIAVAIEDAGFQIRDTLHWCYWSGFPKSLDVSKAIDKLHGAEREVVGHADRKSGPGRHMAGLAGIRGESVTPTITAPATEDARKWDGFGTAVKPAVEPAILARKPLSESSIARNVLKWGTGALNVDGCRFKLGDPMWPGPQDDLSTNHGGREPRQVYGTYAAQEPHQTAGMKIGRYPANLLYCPKASRAERELGLSDESMLCHCEAPQRRWIPSAVVAGVRLCSQCGGWDRKPGGHDAVSRKEGSAGLDSPRAGAGRTSRGTFGVHPTVKPARLMRYLCRLVTPPGGTVLDPFSGSGSCGVAAILEGFDYCGAELSPAYHRLGTARTAHATAFPTSWAHTAPGFSGDADDWVEQVTKAGQQSLF